MSRQSPLPPRAVPRVPWHSTLLSDSRRFELDHPVIINGVVEKWPAFGSWSFDSLSDRIGNRLVKVGSSRSAIFSYGPGENPEFEMLDMLFRDAIKLLQQTDMPGSGRYYIMEQGNRSLPQCYPELLGDFFVPEGTGPRGRKINLWVGASGNVTPVHFDFANNFLAQIQGRKRITFFHPSDSHRLYPRGTIDHPINTSHVDIRTPDEHLHPKFRQATPFDCILDPGEIVYIPPNWWHQVESLDHSISVNFWWNSRFRQCLNPMAIDTFHFYHRQGGLDEVESFIDFDDVGGMEGAAEYCLQQHCPRLAVLFAAAEVSKRRRRGWAAPIPAGLDRWSHEWREMIRSADDFTKPEPSLKEVHRMIQSLRSIDQPPV